GVTPAVHHASCHPPRFLPGAGGSRPCPESLPRFPAGVLPAKPSDRSGDSARGRRLAAALARTADDNAIAVLLDRCQTNPLHQRQLLGAAEGTVGLAVVDDRLRLRRPDVEQYLVEGRGVGGVDVHLFGGKGRAGEEQWQQQGHGGESEGGFHGELLAWWVAGPVRR